MKSNDIESNYLNILATYEKKYDWLYKKLAVNAGIPDCALWIMYFLSISDVEMTQKDLCNSLKFSKQTVNTSITNMANRKYLELKHSKNNNKDKIIVLTNKGRLLIRNKVSNIRSKEISAVKKMGKKKMEEFVKLYSEFYDCLEETFVNEIR